jgi:hypothetical protein
MLDSEWIAISLSYVPPEGEPDVWLTWMTHGRIKASRGNTYLVYDTIFDLVTTHNCGSAQRLLLLAAVHAAVAHFKLQSTGS